MFISLGTAVWVIYTLDHLLDAHSIQHTAHTFRHAFHQKYKKTIGAVCLIVGVIGLANTFLFLPDVIIKNGVLLSLIVLLYLGIINLKILPFPTFKEFTVAFIYTAGITLPIFSLIEEISLSFVAQTLIFFVLASINLLEFALFDFETDTKDEQLSGTRILGHQRLKFRIQVLIILYILLMMASFYFLGMDYLVLFTFLLMGASLILIYIKADFFSKDEYFRIFGDFVFLFPGLYLLYFQL
ncbi:hypothetical protein KMW28_14415 [Flammeovirga yaeyamensis]|uniref:UbiA prenyltransferase n=1 Tax=Flammeovirga yaeyamensis TaxID=367791 RepID=A0AAX1N0E5_9BACT|nr:hypothetical protein [Flammeovirga yaeyamensis]MBB3700215.1 4-hydroxybenzoate polyprenyltransferase [Flammeovirga yaeyamensis]NMF37155.1 hypothetical protein [Flammeovirga yaeyamensis]QWG00846.1 hypothetical protein KMW28_14415 [Flammeovirga yaeyamensis]